MDVKALAQLAKLYRETHDKDVGRRLDAAVKDALYPPRAMPRDLFDGSCDHAWNHGTDGMWRCEKCGTAMSMAPRGKAGAPEKPPPNTEGTP